MSAWDAAITQLAIWLGEVLEQAETQPASLLAEAKPGEAES